MSLNEQNSKSLNRRDFAKLMAGVGVSAASTALSGHFDLVAAEEKRKQETQKIKVKELDDKPYEVDDSIFRRFNSTNIAQNRVPREMGINIKKLWDKNSFEYVMQGKGTGSQDLKDPGEARVQMGANNAFQLTNMYLGAHGEGRENKGPLSWNGPESHKFSAEFKPHPAPTTKDAKRLTDYAKTIARLAGADLVGICRLDRRWVYSATQQNPYIHGKPSIKPIVFENAPKPYEAEDKLVIPEDTQYAIVMGFAMNRQMYQTSPSHLSQTASNIGYARMGFASMSLANFIRFQGYNAIPCKNSTGASVPMAIDAGLGEEGRLGVLVTPEYGPLIRLDKVLTNMPLIPDKPIKFGVEEFCYKCKKCSRECPSKAITPDEKTWVGPSKCNNPGIKKWHINAEKCMNFWIKNGSECGNCIAVCPFTKGAMWTHDATRWAIDKLPVINDVWLTMDDAFGYGATRDTRSIWKTPMGTYGLDPDHMKNTMS